MPEWQPELHLQLGPAATLLQQPPSPASPSAPGRAVAMQPLPPAGVAGASGGTSALTSSMLADAASAEAVGGGATAVDEACAGLDGLDGGGDVDGLLEELSMSASDFEEDAPVVWEGSGHLGSGRVGGLWEPSGHQADADGPPPAAADAPMDGRHAAPPCGSGDSLLQSANEPALGRGPAAQTAQPAAAGSPPRGERPGLGDGGSSVEGAGPPEELPAAEAESPADASPSEPVCDQVPQILDKP
jgi:hypothetical protein